ncbi:hypothetical protein APUTEX25_005584, partial [Auxenochlorella protothecoides]
SPRASAAPARQERAAEGPAPSRGDARAPTRGREGAERPGGTAARGEGLPERMRGRVGSLDGAPHAPARAPTVMQDAAGRRGAGNRRTGRR